MSHAPSQIFIHLVFATKDRRSLIHSIDETGTYLFAVAKHNKSQLLASGGMPDHLHLLLTLPPTISLAELVSKLKANSSRWLSQQTGKFAWQEGYGAFSVSASGLDEVKAYIRN